MCRQLSKSTSHTAPCSHHPASSRYTFCDGSCSISSRSPNMSSTLFSTPHFQFTRKSIFHWAVYNSDQSTDQPSSIAFFHASSSIRLCPFILSMSQLMNFRSALDFIQTGSAIFIIWLLLYISTQSRYQSLVLALSRLLGASTELMSALTPGSIKV